MNTNVGRWWSSVFASVIVSGVASCGSPGVDEKSLQFGALVLQVAHKPTDGTGNVTLRIADRTAQIAVVVQDVSFDALLSPNRASLALPLKGGKLLVLRESTTVKDIEKSKVAHLLTFFARAPVPANSLFPIASLFDGWRSNEVISVVVAEPGGDRGVDVRISLQGPSATVGDTYLERLLQVRDFDKPIGLTVVAQ